MAAPGYVRLVDPSYPKPLRCSFEDLLGLRGVQIFNDLWHAAREQMEVWACSMQKRLGDSRAPKGFECT